MSLTSTAGIKLGIMIDTTKLHIAIIVNNLDIHSRLQGYKKAGTYAVVLFVKWHEVT